MKRPTESGAPRVSVIIPTYNRADLVGRAIDSALTQSRSATQILIIDDGSTDDTASAVAEFGPQVTYIRRENGGGAAARNSGVAHATAPWIAFLDSDDWWCGDHLERLAQAVVQTDGTAAVYFRDTLLDAKRENARLWDVAGFRPDHDVDLASDARDWLMMPTQPMMLQSSLIRTSAYRRSGGLDPSLRRRHDTALWFRLGLEEPMCAVGGIGAVMSSDDQRRLTAVHDGRSRVYWECTRSLYTDVLARWDPTRSDETRELRNRLSLAHRRLVRSHWSERSIRPMASELIAAARLDPASLSHAATVRISRIARRG